MPGGGGETGRDAIGCSGAGCWADCCTARATSSCGNEIGCCRVISAGEPTSRKKWLEVASSVIEATIPMATPTPAPMAVFRPALPGTVRLELRHPGGGPVHPDGRVLVMVLDEPPTEWPINAPRPAPAAGRANAPTMRPCPGSFSA